MPEAPYLQYHYYFKLDYNIADPIEIDFAERELRGLFPARLKRIRNLGDIIVKEPLSSFLSVRLHDFLLRNACYGNTQGFESTCPQIKITELVRRLAYTREIYVVSDLDGNDPNKCLRMIYPEANLGVDTQVFHLSDLDICAFRFICHTYFFENMSAVVRFSTAKTVERQLERVEENIGRLIKHTQDGIQYIPLHPGAALYKEVEDLFEERKEEKLYLSHGFGPPYKAKFHPRMVKAMMNYIGIRSEHGEVLLDPFVGSGTTSIECTLIGVDSIGVDISPECILATKAKVASLQIDPVELQEEIKLVLNRSHSILQESRDDLRGSSLVCHSEISRLPPIPKSLLEEYPNDRRVIILYRLKQIVNMIADPQIRDLLMSTLSKVTSEVMWTRTTRDPIYVFENELINVLKNVYAFHILKSKLNLHLGSARVLQGDVRDLVQLKDESVAGIITSPPYSTAVDYIRNDLPMLKIIHEVPIEELERDMMGNPRFKKDDETLLSEILADQGEFSMLPYNAKKAISELVAGKRKQLALRQLKFLIDMKKAMREMYRVLKPSRKCIIIIGSNSFQTRSGPLQFRNAEYLYNMASSVGFRRSEIIDRMLIKTSYGAIRKESLIILEKSLTT
jgi:tRNA G10  N-methylase Trm11